MTSTSHIEPKEAHSQTWDNAPGARGFFSAVQHKNVGMRYMVTAFLLFLVGGVLSLLMRLQLAQSENDFLEPDTYNELFTMHGTTMMFLFAVPFLEGLASYLLPLMIGSRDLPFPRYNAFNYWCYLLGGIILYSSYIFAMVPDAGWFAYVPLSGPEFSDKAMDFWLFGLTLAEIAAVGAAIEIGVAVLRTRAPGMSLNRMPIFAWTMLAVSFTIIVAFIPLIVASVLLELDRTIGTAFFDTQSGGNPLLWQHLFWIFGHPEVYVMFLPGAAIISHVIPVHARHPLVAYPLVVVALATTAVMSLGLWVHHMYSVGLPSITLSFFTASSMAITLASGLQVFAWLATLWLGRARFTVPMMFAIGFIVTFVAGGITGVMVASVAFDQQVHDTYFVVAHFHYVLIGGMLFPVFAGLHHWWSKFTGKLYSTIAGHVSFWLIFVGFHTTFFPMHLTGLWGMPRRVYTYERELGLDFVNLLSTIGAFVLAAGVLVLTLNFVRSWFWGRPAPQDPWHGDSLEWVADSPAPSENWPAIPVVASRTPGWNPAPDDHPYAEPVREAFEHQPKEFRASPMTTVVSGEPDGAVLMPSPTLWPLVSPVGLAVIAVAMLTQWYPLSFLGILIAVVGLAGWAWRNESEFARNDLSPLAGRFPFEARGSRSIGWWAASSAAIVAVIAVATLAFSALYLQVNAAVWPVGGMVDNTLAFVAVTIALLVAAVATGWGSRRSGDVEWGTVTPGVRTAHLTTAVIALVAGAAALLLVCLVWFGGDIDPSEHAYQSSVWTLLATQSLVTLAALFGTGIAVMGRLRHRRDSRPGMLLRYSSIFWAATVATWLLTWATIDLFPRLVI
ncbi:cbb3-type cytochrome c oxidase subunit I [Salinibacterium sp. SYSU T00001]|uniref:cytochrome c oxidase subunit I n=1 Tax=Homoserinimonas sedimenticola TaxID=2986805 RepID=UPI002235D9A5|nr:cbb3-type cytochrome c oxidase subunit I [Salinibacterium sedimenticola]MCW4384783.1 cbb3-type cytochrome c oxidase subunit I [Salinibacterium sedimenticola]